MTIFFNCNNFIYYQQGSKDATSRRSISTVMSKVTRNVFQPHDDLLLRHRIEGNKRMEPDFFAPIIPVILVNGTVGIGTGWTTVILEHNLNDIITNLKRILNG